MNTIKIYTRRMALFIKSKGVKTIYTVPDENKPQFLNWIFEDTTEVRNAMAEFSAIFYMR